MKYGGKEKVLEDISLVPEVRTTLYTSPARNTSRPTRGCIERTTAGLPPTDILSRIGYPSAFNNELRGPLKAFELSDTPLE
jgi:hypothetical protein